VTPQNAPLVRAFFNLHRPKCSPEKAMLACLKQGGSHEIVKQFTVVYPSLSASGMPNNMGKFNFILPERRHVDKPSGRQPEILGENKNLIAYAG
jgi:hypothetical protein